MSDLALVIESPGVAAVREVPPTEGPVAVQTVCTGISAGTELSFLTGTNPALHASFDPAAVTASGATLTAVVPTMLHRIDASAFRLILLGGMGIPGTRL